MSPSFFLSLLVFIATLSSLPTSSSFLIPSTFVSPPSSSLSSLSSTSTSTTSPSAQSDSSENARYTAFREATGRPYAILHCSIIQKQDELAFLKSEQKLGIGSYDDDAFCNPNSGNSVYEIAPPPIRSIKNGKTTPAFQNTWSSGKIMKFYTKCDAVIVTLPRLSSAPASTKDYSLEDRLSGVRWLIKRDTQNPDGLVDAVERIIVLDIDDLVNLPLKNSDVEARGLDFEAFWEQGLSSKRRTRLLLRTTKPPLDTLDKTLSDFASTNEEFKKLNEIKSFLFKNGIKIEPILQSETSPSTLSVMSHIGRTSPSYNLVVHRAGCYGERGIKSIASGAFQSIAAHVAVPYFTKEGEGGGLFWTKILAEHVTQSALGSSAIVEAKSRGELEDLDRLDDQGELQYTSASGEKKRVKHIRIDLDLKIK